MDEMYFFLFLFFKKIAFSFNSAWAFRNDRITPVNTHIFKVNPLFKSGCSSLQYSCEGWQMWVPCQWKRLTLPTLHVFVLQCQAAVPLPVLYYLDFLLGLFLFSWKPSDGAYASIHQKQHERRHCVRLKLDSYLPTMTPADDLVASPSCF